MSFSPPYFGPSVSRRATSRSRLTQHLRSQLNAVSLLLALLISLCSPNLLAAGSPPPELPEATITELAVGDRKMQVWSWPIAGPEQGRILFSHGAASAPWKYAPLISRWIAAGYKVYAPLHVDSDDHPQQKDYTGMKSWEARLQDMQVLADTYGGDRYIVAGHSYGALVALTKGGATAVFPEGIQQPVADKRVSMVLAFSPPAAIPGFIEKEGYGKVSVPSLIQTGTLDVPQGSDASWKTHLDAYDASPASGNHYALVLEGVDHYFGGAICRPELDAPKQMAQITTAADISLLMISAYHGEDSSAQQELEQWLAESGPTALLKK